MACTPLPGGGFVCGPKPRTKPCSAPGCHSASSLLCDWKLTGPKAGKTCDAPLCSKHATQPAPSKDLCPAHAAHWRQRTQP